MNFIEKITRLDYKFEKDDWIIEQKTKTLIQIFALVIPLLLINIYLRYSIGETFEAFIDVIVCIVLYLLAMMLKRSAKYRVFVFTTFIIISTTAITLEMFMAQHEVTRSFWFFPLIVITYYITDRDEGLKWTLLFVFIQLLSMYFNSSPNTLQYFTVIATLIITAALLHFYDFIKEKEQKTLLELKEQQISLKEKDIQLLKQSRLAQMGEMMSMIAHQWKQPLNAITMTTASLEVSLKLEEFDFSTKEGLKEADEFIVHRLHKINENIQFLIKTMDDFRNFHNPNKAVVERPFEEIVTKAMKIIKATLDNNKIELILNYNSNEIMKFHENEMIQVILNILKNAQDNFNEKNIEHRKITITTEFKTLSICDNGGGIPENIIDKIFDSYFSTKDEKNGTGLGLDLSKMIVEEHHNGKISAANIEDGVCFSINLE